VWKGGVVGAYALSLVVVVQHDFQEHLLCNNITIASLYYIQLALKFTILTIFLQSVPEFLKDLILSSCFSPYPSYLVNSLYGVRCNRD
jgi:hypothetical protein